jgi:L-asparaginase
LPSAERLTVILGTGGTIAGTAASPLDDLGYRAGQLAVADLVDSVPGLRGLHLETEQVAQVDSKDMSYEVWQRLARRLAVHLARPEVAGIVVTHGTDTLEETAYFLQRVLAPSKPVVLTAAMRPATSVHADGPQNLLDAVSVARCDGACGVVAVLAGDVFRGADLRKAHTHRLNAFEPGEGGLLGRIEGGRLRLLRPWPQGAALGAACTAVAATAWPRVEIVLNHAGADGRNLEALLALGVDGLVLAGTGNGTLSSELEAAALRAQSAGVRVLRASRCGAGPVSRDAGALPGAGTLSAVQARVELLLQCLAARGSAPPT